MLRRRPHGKYLRLGLRCWHFRLTLRKAAALHKALSDQAPLVPPEIPPFLDTLSKEASTGCRCRFTKGETKTELAVAKWHQP